MSGMPIGRPRFVTLDEVLSWHETAIAEYGGSLGVRDLALLESALAQPRQGFAGSFAHDYPLGMAAAYAFHIAKNHPFVDGNKRAALLCCGAFLRMNGWDLESEGVQAADAIVELVEGRHDKVSFAEWLKGHTRPRPSLELRDFFHHLRAAHLLEFFRASYGGGPAEIGQTSREAELAIPVLAETFREIAALQQSGGDPRHVDLLKGQLTLLAAVYRIAEDMGYEW